MQLFTSININSCLENYAILFRVLKSLKEPIFSQPFCDLLSVNNNKKKLFWTSTSVLDWEMKMQEIYMNEKVD